MTQAERSRLMTQLHDGPVQDVTVARMRVDILRRRLSAERTAPVELDELDELDATLADAAESLRGIVAELAAEPG
jgi:signal transduction histidine kinase